MKDDDRKATILSVITPRLHVVITRDQWMVTWGARLAVFYIVKFSVKFRNKNSYVALLEFLFESSLLEISFWHYFTKMKYLKVGENGEFELYFQILQHVA